MPISIPTDLLPWYWAYREQLYLHDKHDAVWIKEASRDWADDGQLHAMLNSYGLIRGSAAKLFEKENPHGRTAFLKACDPLFSPKLTSPVRPAELDRRWRQAVRKVRRIRQSPDWEPGSLRSATSKLFWFYQPKHMVMFDQYNRLGLARWAKHKKQVKRQMDLTDENFQEIFDVYFRTVARRKIADVERFFDRSYPYPRRVAEKRLWLCGSNGEDDVIENLKAGLKSVPLKRAGA